MSRPTDVLSDKNFIDVVPYFDWCAWEKLKYVFFFFFSKRVFCVKRRNWLIENLHYHIFIITNISIFIILLQVTTCI